MRARLRGKPFRLVIVDHIHLMPMDGRDYRVAFNDAMARLKDLAKREGIVLILLAQLGRQKGKVTYGGETFETTQPVPKLSYYRESSALEQIADIAMFVYRFPNQLDKPSKEAWIMVAGQRDGRPIKDVRATWSEVSYRFQPTDPADMVPPPPVFTQQAMA
jgi:replicative DNA helicase